MTKGKRWLWFFVTLALLAATAVTTLIWFNLSQQLTREKLAEARAKWLQRRPSDYDLEYVKRGSATGTFVVQVRGGKVVSASMDGRPLEPRLYSSCNMLTLFDDIERFLDLDAQSGTRAFTVATFDPQDGHLGYYRRSVMGTRQWVEIRDVKLNTFSNREEHGQIQGRSRQGPARRRQVHAPLAAAPRVPRAWISPHSGRATTKEPIEDAATLRKCEYSFDVGVVGGKVGGASEGTSA
jgi:hypothetical protein